MAQKITTVKVVYQKIEGWHVFTSPDLEGLYVASPDPRRAYDDVGTAIRNLKYFNEDQRVTSLKAPITLKEFLKLVRAFEGKENIAPHIISGSRGSEFEIAA